MGKKLCRRIATWPRQFLKPWSRLEFKYASHKKLTRHWIDRLADSFKFATLSMHNCAIDRLVDGFSIDRLKINKNYLTKNKNNKFQNTKTFFKKIIYFSASSIFLPRDQPFSCRVLVRPQYTIQSWFRKNRFLFFKK